MNSASYFGANPYRVELQGRPATFAEVVMGWREDEAFRKTFNDTLAESRFGAFRWETPGVDSHTLGQNFEFVLLDEPGLATRPDPEAFAEHFREEDVATFANLGGDATLVVPRPLGDPKAYPHLAAFVRGAPGSQRDAFWKAVGDAMHVRIGGKPVWLSTAGAGVPWLHVRLDDRPKYYGFEPYRRPPRIG